MLAFHFPTRIRGSLTYGLAERPALANGDLVTLLNTESRGDVGGKVLVSLLVSGVLGDVVEVLSSDDEGSVHLGGNNGAGQDTATDGDETGEGALLVCKAKFGQHLVVSRKVARDRIASSSSSMFLRSSQNHSCFRVASNPKLLLSHPELKTKLHVPM